MEGVRVQIMLEYDAVIMQTSYGALLMSTQFN